MKKLVASALDKVFKESSDFLVIGFTGRTGSGCSTCAKILTELTLNLPEPSKSHYLGNEQRKFRIVKKYVEAYWSPFEWLHITSVITRYILEMSFDEFIDFISNILKSERSVILKYVANFEPKYNDAHSKIVEFLSCPENTLEEINRKKIDAYDLYFKYLPEISKLIKESINTISVGTYTKLYQVAGDNIRASGKVNCSDFDDSKVFSFAKTIEKVIVSARFFCKINNKPCYIALDAIRNPYEARFLKQRHPEFYLISVNTKNENRLNHLRKSHKLSEAQIEELDKKEYPKTLTGYNRYISQNIQNCIEIADIHINNPRTDSFGHNELRCQLAWYVSLMLHSGLIMPTSMESCMQIAYSVKKNSGCISRQVGAVVTDSSFAVKSVGWNNTAQGQVPCLLRSAEDLLSGFDESAYSVYEKNDAGFRKVLESKFIKLVNADVLQGRNLSFCFKDIQNEVKEEKNQVHTRSLHAEENAFLQIAKHGGQPLRGGVLFTTASPCELCAKKAYQLGISQIFYIDPYPGIATSHILSVGDNAPDLILYRGAVGSAFDRLYQPIMPYKDELDLLFSIPKFENEKDLQISDLKEENKRLKEALEQIQHQMNKKDFEQVEQVEQLFGSILPIITSS